MDCIGHSWIGLERFGLRRLVRIISLNSRYSTLMDWDCSKAIWRVLDRNQVLNHDPYLRYVSQPTSSMFPLVDEDILDSFMDLHLSPSHGPSGGWGGGGPRVVMP